MNTTRQRRDNRKTPRVDVARGIWVAWRADREAASVSRVKDLSVGGAFISTPSPLRCGSTIQLLFSLPEGEIRFTAEVRYTEEGKGMGVQFIKMGAADRVRLEELIRRLNS